MITGAGKKMKIGIDTNVLIRLFDTESGIENLKGDENNEFYTEKNCLWEMVKYLKSLELKDKNTERVVADFLERKEIKETKTDVEHEEIKEFLKKCKEEGIICHREDAEIMLAFKKEGIEKIYSDDKNFKKAAGILGIITERFEETR